MYVLTYYPTKDPSLARFSNAGFELCQFRISRHPHSQAQVLKANHIDTKLPTIVARPMITVTNLVQRNINNPRFIDSNYIPSYFRFGSADNGEISGKLNQGRFSAFASHY